MKSLKNPFYYGGVAEDAYFCNRVDEIAVLKQDIQSGLNILIYAPRRFGKTSLIIKTLKEIKTKYIFIDLMGITDEIEFINAYFNAISSSMETTAEKTVRYFKSILKIKPNINVSFDMEGKPSYSLSFSKTEKGRVLSEVLNIPMALAKNHKNPPVVVFDEFQEISRLKLEEKLRSQIQLHGNQVSYIFLGSKKSIMKKIFFDKNSAFFKSVKHMPIVAISKREWILYIREGFKKKNMTIEDKLIKDLLAVSKGFPYYTQQIAYELYNNCNAAIKSSHLSEAIRSILDREEDLFLQEWDMLSQYQKKSLKLLITNGGENLYGKDKMEMFRLNNSNLKKGIEGLLHKDVIDKKGNSYYLQDPLFEYYIRERLITV